MLTIKYDFVSRSPFGLGWADFSNGADTLIWAWTPRVVSADDGLDLSLLIFFQDGPEPRLVQGATISFVLLVGRLGYLGSLLHNKLKI